jgi:hypothetical protein
MFPYTGQLLFTIQSDKSQTNELTSSITHISCPLVEKTRHTVKTENKQASDLKKRVWPVSVWP